jgi:hypothetical protein
VQVSFSGHCEIQYGQPLVPLALDLKTISPGRRSNEGRVLILTPSYLNG